MGYPLVTLGDVIYKNKDIISFCYFPPTCLRDLQYVVVLGSYNTLFETAHTFSCIF